MGYEDIKIVRYNEVKDELVKLFRKQSVIPILGAGFSKNEKSRSGKVPDGTKYKMDMIESIKMKRVLSLKESADIESSSFSNVASVYNILVPIKERREYLKKFFLDVKLDKSQEKINFLQVEWPYIYTLNIDDAVEKNSLFNHVVSINRPVDDKIFDEEKCVIKLHGDIKEIISYNDSKMIFSETEYATSLMDNQSVLKRVQMDMQFQNLMYIGCSLDDELDLLASAAQVDENYRGTNRYYCTIQNVSMMDKIKLSKFGISHIILFDSYEGIYNHIYESWLESKKLQTDDLSKNAISKFGQSFHANYQETLPYLILGKKIKNNNEVIFPYFFTSRKIINNIMQKIEKCIITVISGGSYSGKTYLMWDIARRMSKRKVYVFQSSDRLSDKAFDTIRHENNICIIFDSKCLSGEQENEILTCVDEYKNKHIKVVVFFDLSNSELYSTIKYMQINGDKGIDYIDYSTRLKNKFSDDDRKNINKKLSACDIPLFENESNIDNIIHIARKLNEESKFSSLTPIMKNEKYLAVLITLAIKEKVYDYECIIYNFYYEMKKQIEKLKPLIDEEVTFTYERSNKDNSNAKYIVNANYWLKEQLSQYAISDNYEYIANAYKYIIKQIITYYGRPTLEYSTIKEYREFILFDNISAVFLKEEKNGFKLIKKIYDALSDLLSLEPNYKHQRAKCYIRFAKYTKNRKEKKDILNMAYRFVTSSISIFEQRQKDKYNRKLQISLDHAIYTKAVICCHKCVLDDFVSIKDNNEAIETMHTAFLSPFNTFSYVKSDIMNFGDVVNKVLNKFILEKKCVNLENYKKVEYLLNKKINENQREPHDIND